MSTPVLGSASTSGEAVSMASEYLLFRLGKQILALPMTGVNHVAQMAAGFAYRGKGAESHFIFNGQPLAYIPLWDRLELDSLYLEYEQLLEMLPQRLNDHVEWMGALSASIRTGVPFAKARSPYECAFGKWYYAHSADDRRLTLLLDQFEQPHAAIHGLADKLLSMAEAGQVREALALLEDAEHTTLAQLRKLFQSTLQLVQDLQRRLAIIVHAGGESCALGVDGIVDIVQVTADRVRCNSRWAHQRVQATVTSGLLVLDDSSVAPIIDWQKLA